MPLAGRSSPSRFPAFLKHPSLPNFAEKHCPHFDVPSGLQIADCRVQSAGRTGQDRTVRRVWSCMQKRQCSPVLRSQLRDRPAVCAVCVVCVVCLVRAQTKANLPSVTKTHSPLNHWNAYLPPTFPPSYPHFTPPIPNLLFFTNLLCSSLFLSLSLCVFVCVFVSLPLPPSLSIGHTHPLHIHCCSTFVVRR